MSEQNKYIHKLIAGHSLTRVESYDCMLQIGKGDWSDIHIASLLTLYRYRNVNIEELVGFRDALLDLSKALTIEADHTIDLCGTGGDGKNTINISTLASIVVASCGGKLLNMETMACLVFVVPPMCLRRLGIALKKIP